MAVPIFGNPRAIGRAVGIAATILCAAKNVQIGANQSRGGGVNILNTPTSGSRIGFEVGKWNGGSGPHIDVYIKKQGAPFGPAVKGPGSNLFKLEHWQPWK